VSTGAASTEGDLFVLVFIAAVGRLEGGLSVALDEPAGALVVAESSSRADSAESSGGVLALIE
jgi:hypothetical protein